MIEDALRRYISGKASDADRKLFGQVARDSMDTPLFKLIEGIIKHTDNIESISHISHWPNDVKIHSFTYLCGMKAVLYKLNDFILEEQSIIAKEKEELEIAQPEEEVTPISYGEGVDTSDSNTLTI